MLNKVKDLFLNEELKKRYSAFVWSTGMMALAFLADQSLANLGMLNLPEKVSLFDGLIAFNPTIVVGLVLGQISKYIHNKVKARNDNLG